MSNLKKHLADCEVNVEHNKKDLTKSRDKLEREVRSIEDLKSKLEKSDS